MTVTMYVLTDESGDVKGFYAGEMFAELPQGAVPILDQDWVSWLEAQRVGKRLNFLNGVLERVEAVVAEAAPVAETAQPMATSGMVLETRLVESPALQFAGPSQELRQDYDPAPIIDRQ